MPIAEIPMTVTLEKEAEAVIAEVPMTVSIVKEAEAIIANVSITVSIIPTIPPPEDGELPPDWQKWLEENWEIVAAVIIGIVILAVILTRRK